MKGRAGWLILVLELAFPFLLLGEKPFSSEQAATLEKGQFSLDLAVAYRDRPRDFGIADRDAQAELGVAHLRFGLGQIVELQISGVALLRVDQGGVESSNSGDWRFGTKIRLWQAGQGRSLLSFLYQVKLPNGSDEDGGATDETDFFALLLFSKAVGKRSTLHSNVGLGILGDPASTRSQNDVFLLRLAWERKLGKRQLLGLEGLLQGGPKTGDDPRLLRLVYARGVGVWAFYGAVGLGSGDDSDNARFDLGFRRSFKLFNSR